MPKVVSVHHQRQPALALCSLILAMPLDTLDADILWSQPVGENPGQATPESVLLEVLQFSINAKFHHDAWRPSPGLSQRAIVVG